MIPSRIGILLNPEYIVKQPFIDYGLNPTPFWIVCQFSLQEEALVPPGKGFPPAEFNASTYNSSSVGCLIG
jgi:hypothetical protein